MAKITEGLRRSLRRFQREFSGRGPGLLSTTHKRVSKPTGFKSQVLGTVQTRNCGAPEILVPVWVVFWHPKGCQNRWFSKWPVLGTFKARSFCAPAIWYPFGCFRFLEVLTGVDNPSRNLSKPNFLEVCFGTLPTFLRSVSSWRRLALKTYSSCEYLLILPKHSERCLLLPGMTALCLILA